MSERLLTKSRFKLALSCPSKLYFTTKEEYAVYSGVNFTAVPI